MVRSDPRTSDHFHGSEEKRRETMERDLSGRRVLVSDDFAYFGREARPLPAEIVPLVCGRGHRRLRPGDPAHRDVVRVLAALPRWVHGRPGLWGGEDAAGRAGELSSSGQRR
jgi:hypothetical protein